MRRIARLVGILFLVSVLPGIAVSKAPPLPPAGPFGRPTLPVPSQKRLPLADPLGLLSPGPPILRAPVRLPGPLPGTVLVPGYWQRNRWVPGRLERRERRP